ncbi:class I SAM-dependent methyltransferase [Stieleria varia]|nr:class I SAM-dependent methyltransferase [Stieleria varia]
MLFRDETEGEVKFFEKAFERIAKRKVKRVLEPGCGSGRLVVAMAAEGYEMTGLDLSESMLNYVNKQLKRKKLTAETVIGDMTQMDLPHKYDAAFCTFNTFRHLLSEKDAEAHLRSVANHLNKGGIYILGLHLLPLDAFEHAIERFTTNYGGTRVTTTIKVIEFDRRKRIEVLRVLVKATKRSGVIERVKSEFPLRVYTCRQLKSLFKKVDDVLELAAVHDYEYDIDETATFDDDLTEGVFVLRKR